MNIFWNVLRGFIEWIASIMMRTSAPQGLLINIVIGIEYFP